MCNPLKILIKAPNIKFHENPSHGSCACGKIDRRMERWTDRQTDGRTWTW